MNRLWVAALVAAGVLVAGLVVRAYVTRKGGEFLSPGSRRTLTGFVLLTAVLVGLAALAVALNPATTDTVVVSLVRSLPGLFLAGVIVILSVLLGRLPRHWPWRLVLVWEPFLSLDRSRPGGTSRTVSESQTITIGETHGRIVEVGLASTRIEQADGASVEIPNLYFLEHPVVMVDPG